MKKSILVFGLGFLQKSLIEQCKSHLMYVVGMDITDDALLRDEVDAFEVVAGDDFEGSLAVAKKYAVSGVVCAATDKPLVMMARVAEALLLPFYSVDTAKWSTDKLLMKQRFELGGVPHAKGRLVGCIEEFESEGWNYPVIVKPRDNSGSRGVIYCENEAQVCEAMTEAMQYTKKGNVLVEEFIDGPEYSIESLHYHDETHVLQFTQKQTTTFPYNVELGHIQPADFTEEQRSEIRTIIGKIARCLNFDGCGSHTELKVSSRGIVVIETSPRLGGDFITSTLVPLSTGINMERLLARMSVGEAIADEEFLPKFQKSSGVVFFELPEGRIESIGDIDRLGQIPGCKAWEFDKHVGDEVNRITSSLNRYGYAIFQTEGREQTIESMEEARNIVRKLVKVDILNNLT